jgi:hypothetical protein
MPPSSPSIGPVTVTEILPAGLEVVQVDPVCSVSGRRLTCVIDEPIAPRTSRVITVVTSVSPDLTQSDITSSVSISGAGELVTTNNRANGTFAVQVQPGLSVAVGEIVEPVRGADSYFDVVVKNAGPSSATESLRITIQVPDGIAVEDIAVEEIDPLNWECTVTDDGEIGCVSRNVLPPGTESTIRVNAKVTGRPAEAMQSEVALEANDEVFTADAQSEIERNNSQIAGQAWLIALVSLLAVGGALVATGLRIRSRRS